MQCPSCGFDNPKGMKFCGECATPVNPCCPQCGFENPPGFVFCAQCATPLAGQAPVPSPAQFVQQQRWTGIRLHVVLPAITTFLQREGRITYSTLRQIFGLDDVLLDDIRRELGLRRLAIDEGGEVLVWTGEAQPAVRPTALPASPAVVPDAIAVTSPVSIDDMDITHDESAAISEPIRSSPEAERRQLTVMFCDLAASRFSC